LVSKKLSGHQAYKADFMKKKKMGDETRLCKTYRKFASKSAHQIYESLAQLFQGRATKFGRLPWAAMEL
jgi:hypothetical protein